MKLSLPRHPAWLAVALAAAIGAVLLATAPPAPAPVAAPAPAAPVAAGVASPFGTGPAVAGPDAAPAAPAPAAAAALPTQPEVGSLASLPSLSLDELKALKEELAKGPDPDGEFARIADFMMFSDALQRLRQLRSEGGDPAEILALAQWLDQGLPQRLARREMSAGEARLVKALVLEVQEPDAGRRQAALQQWQAQEAQAAASTAPAPDARELAYKREEAAALAAFQARPAAQRDPRALEAELEALRRASFGATPR